MCPACLDFVAQSVFAPVVGSGWEVGYRYVDDPYSASTCVDGLHRLCASDPVGAWVVGTTANDGQGGYGFPAGSGGVYTDIPIE